MKNTANYKAVVFQFAAKGQFLQCRVREHIDGKTSTGWWIERNGGHCDCCGSERMKVLYPLQVNGESYWVGQNCFKALVEIGAVTEAGLHPPVVEIYY